MIALWLGQTFAGLHGQRGGHEHHQSPAGQAEESTAEKHKEHPAAPAKLPSLKHDDADEPRPHVDDLEPLLVRQNRNRVMSACILFVKCQKWWLFGGGKLQDLHPKQLQNPGNQEKSRPDRVV